MAVQNFAADVRERAAAGGRDAGGAESTPSAMVLRDPEGPVLQALGEAADHHVAGRVVANLGRQQPDGLGGRNPSTPLATSTPSRPTTSPSQLVLARAGARLQAPPRRGGVSFGAVYEHHDQLGKPRVVASTSLLPERQFQLDWQERDEVRELSAGGGPGASGRLVWVGVGCGPVGDEEMAAVRQAVVEARSERLQIEKLGSEKPYSRHF